MPSDWINDPYSEFLDLPPGERPPHFYDLLELELFCAHRERIEHAIRKQFRKIKPYQDHQRRELREAIQDVMNQIAQARVVLGDPRQKEAYDIALAEKLSIDREALLASRMATPVPEHALRVVAGPDHLGHLVELLTDQAVTLGRDPHCVVPLDSPRLAPLHGRLTYVKGRWVYTQVAKQQVSLMNEEKVSERPLEDGDRLEIGGYALRFRRLEEWRREPAGLSAGGPPLTLILTRGPSVPDAIFHILPPESVLIGECATALWQLADERVSRHHCRVSFEQDEWTVRDLNSTNGTYVNGQRITRHALADHDRLTLGPFEVLVRPRR